MNEHDGWNRCHSQQPCVCTAPAELYACPVSKKGNGVPGAGSTRSCCKCSPPPPALAISLMSTPEQKQAWILCAEYPMPCLFTINASDPAVLPRAGMHGRNDPHTHTVLRDMVPCFSVNSVRIMKSTLKSYFYSDFIFATNPILILPRAQTWKQ